MKTRTGSLAVMANIMAMAESIGVPYKDPNMGTEQPRRATVFSRKYCNRSKYQPHNGTQEKARRVRQMQEGRLHV
jgi:hypothetical protein